MFRSLWSLMFLSFFGFASAAVAEGGLEPQGLPAGTPVAQKPWIRTFSARSSEKTFRDGFSANAIAAFPDGGVAIAGHTSRWTGANIRVDTLGWLVRLASDGSELWRRTYGRGDFSTINAISALPDGGLALAGETKRGYGRNGWLVRTDASGNEVWHRSYGGDSPDSFEAIALFADGGFAIVGSTMSYSSEPDRSDGWLVRVDAAGQELLSRNYGYDGWDRFFAVAVLPDGGLALAGEAQHGPGPGFLFITRDWGDGWLVLVNSSGDELWRKTYGGRDRDGFFAVAGLPDGGFALAGYTTSNFSSGPKGSWLIRVNKDGKRLWRRNFGRGGPFIERFSAVAALPDGGLALAGYTARSVNDTWDAWLIRTDAAGKELWRRNYRAGKRLYVNAIAPLPDGGFALAGRTTSNGVSTQMGWVLRVTALGEGPAELRRLALTCAGARPSDGVDARSVQTSLAARGYTLTVGGRWATEADEAFEHFIATGGCEDPMIVDAQ